MEIKGGKRVTLGSKLAAVLVAAGSSVGLGNIWRFPYVAGENGGGAFMLIYLLCVLLMGLPIMLSEFVIGRESRKNAVGAFHRLNPRWSLIGYNSVLISVLIMGFYFVVSGWTAEYFVNAITGKLSALGSTEEYRNIFVSFTQSTWPPIIYTWIFVLLTHLVIVLGVKKGIEQSSKIMMPILFTILIALSINSLCMKGAGAGLEFLFKPDFSKITFSVVLQALGQAFFSLSISLGCLITYASYFPKDNNLRSTAVQVTLLDTLVAVLAGVIIFPAVFSAGIAPTEGPSLVFITLPGIFNTLPMSGVWSTIFFLLLIIAALTSTISLHEVVTLYIHEEWKLSRLWAARLTTIIVGALGTLASLSLGILSDVKILGLNIFDLLDKTTSNILLPLGGLFTCIFVGWVLDRKVFDRQLTNDGKLRFALLKPMHLILRYLCPVILFVIFLDSCGVI